MGVNANKCKVLRVTNKKNHVNTIYKIIGEEVEVVTQHSYLGIQLDEILS